MKRNFLPYDGNNRRFSRQLRRNMTEAEIRLWYTIRMKQIDGLQFYRQKPIGDYIVDFYCPAAKLVIEVDGSQHYAPEGLRADAARDDYLRRMGLAVLRYNDNDVLTNLEGVIEDLIRHVRTGRENPS